MSLTTLRPGARALGALLVSAALVGVPSLALADETPTATPTTTASAEPSATPSGEPTASPTQTPDPSATPAPSSPSPTATPSTSTPSPTAERPAPTKRPAVAAAVPGAGEPETQAASDFIARTLDEFGEHYVYPDAEGDLTPEGYPDHGNTIDGFLALAASGSNLEQAGQSEAWLESTIGSYIGTDFGDTYVGGTAKSLIGVLALGEDPSDVGGVDLVETLRGLETDSGRFSDTGSGDYTITITQALAVIALAKAGEPVTTRSVDFLLDQQCADGGFRSGLGGATCVSDPDATAFAAQALLAVDDALLCWADVEGTRAAAADGADAALDFLEGLQGENGGVTNDAGDANANTTGVAGQAFIAGGRAAAATAAAEYVASLQYDDTAAAALGGAIAFTAADRTTGTAPEDSDIRATPQATLLLAGRSLVDVYAPYVEPRPAVTECPAEPTPTPTVTETPTETTEPTATTNPTTTPTAGDDGGSTSTPVAAAPTGSLAQTGSDPLLPVLVGLALVLLGALALVASRRRGAHA